MKRRHRKRGSSPRAAGAAAASALLLSSFSADAYDFVFSTFTGDDSAGMKLSIYSSPDALNFTLLSNTGFGGPTTYLRDPSIMKHVDGKYYVAYTDPPGDSCCGEENHFSVATSSDLVHWTNFTIVDAGVTGVAHTWAPEWFVEGSTVHVIANIDTTDTDSNFKPYLYTATDDTLMNWTAPVPLGFGPNYIDTFVLKSGSTYHAFAKNETTRYCEHATAPTLTGPWTFVGTGNWAGWGSGMEGPAVVQVEDGTWRIFMDGQNSTPFVTATSPDLYTWSSWIALPGLGNIVRHGTVIRNLETGGSSDGGADGTAVDDGGVPSDTGRADGSGKVGDGGGMLDASTPAESGVGMTASADAADGVEASFEAAGGDAGSLIESGTAHAGVRSVDAAGAGGARDGGASTEASTAIDGSGVEVGAVPALTTGGCSCHEEPAGRETEPYGTAAFAVLALVGVRLRGRRAHARAGGFSTATRRY
jgi:hypothetical protein